MISFLTICCSHPQHTHNIIKFQMRCRLSKAACVCIASLPPMGDLYLSSPNHHYMTSCTGISLPIPPPPSPQVMAYLLLGHYKTLSSTSLPLSALNVLKSLYIHSSNKSSLSIDSCAVHCKNLVAHLVDPIIIEKISAMKNYSKSRRQQLLVLPTLTLYLVATSILCLLLTSPGWFPRLCSLLSFFLLTTLPDLATAFLLSPKCLFIVGNLIVAFLVSESRLAPKRDQPSLVNEIQEEHAKRNMATTPKAMAAVVVAGHSSFFGAVEGEEVKEEEAEEEELHKRVEDFIARVKKQRKLEAKSFYDADR